MTRRGAPRLVGALLAALPVACGGKSPPPQPQAAEPVKPAERPLGPRVFPMDLAPVLDDPRRDEWQRPDDVIRALHIRPGSRVADVGCGTGYFTVRLLRATGEKGHVIAADIQQGMLDLLKERLGPDELACVTLRKSEPDRPLLPEDACDLILCANTINEVDDADVARFMRSMVEGLVPGGRLALVNWKAERTRFGPPLDHRISAQRVRELAEGAGLALTEDLDLLPMHSFLIFTKPKG